jgi:hypothetical protein
MQSITKPQQEIETCMCVQPKATSNYNKIGSVITSYARYNSQRREASGPRSDGPTHRKDG